ncbi:cation diffusion facilitator family transporter [Aeromicrobium endophyticum]|uniref:Cation diffusion facilitator family transporter n=1 Tax=Aeromicrobium endophyticum TaxID=2292704 RepID=A0A371P4Q7_9ACTN|nr:cation diffusion facilitator family transporter [Aeromicrobium endophyticum]REK70927.1 cation diffusion facilitator family transporter [Aeromicrobium endophyticum]
MNVTVVLAFAANALVALAKSVAAVLTGSASMVAEAAHSWADTGNEVFLLVADRRSKRRPDRQHPLGYGREAYVWSMFAAVGLFVAGAVVSITHGVQQLTADEAAESYTIAYAVLGIAFVLEGISFAQALRQVRGEASRVDDSVLQHVLETSDPTLRAVFAEDAAALTGLVIAAAGIGLHQATGSPVYDAIGSILVGVLLAVVAFVLIDRNRRFLVGMEVAQPVRDVVRERIAAMDEVSSVGYLHVEFVGPHRVYVVASVDLVGDAVESSVADRLRELEHRLEREDAVVEAVLTVSRPGAPPDADLPTA